MNDSYVSFLSLLEKDEIIDRKLYTKALIKQQLTEKEFNKLIDDAISHNLMKLTSKDILQEAEKIKDPIKRYKFVKNYLQNKIFEDKLKVIFKDPEPYIENMREYDDPHQYIVKTLTLLFDDYEFPERMNYEVALSIYKGNTIEEKLENYRSKKEYSIITEDLQTMITNLVWEKIKHNFVKYEEQIRIIKASLDRSLKFMIDRKISSLKIFEFVQEYADYFNKTMMKNGQRIGRATATTLFQDSQQGAMKNFSSATKISLGIPGDTYQSFDNLDAIINLSQNPPDPRNVIMFDDYSLKNVANMSNLFQSVIMENIILDSNINTNKTIDIQLNFIEMYKKKITPSMITKKLKELDSVKSVSIDFNTHICKISISAGDITPQTPINERLMIEGHIQKTMINIKLIKLIGIANIKLTEIVNIWFGKFINDLTEKDGIYTVYLNTGLMRRFGQSQEKIMSYCQDRLAKFFKFPKIDFVVDDKFTIKIKNFIPNNLKEIKLVLIDLPFYINLSDFTDEIQSIDGRLSIGKATEKSLISDKYVEIGNAFISAMKSDKITPQEVGLLKNLKDYHINFSEGLAFNRATGEVKDASILKKFEGVKYIDQKFTNKYKIWYIIAKPIDTLADHQKILKTKGVNKKATMCNNPHFIYAMYGIMATQSFLEYEIAGQVSTSIVKSYSELPAKAMTSHGVPIPATRGGLQTMDTIEGTNSKAPFYEMVFSKVTDIGTMGGYIQGEKGIMNMLVK